MLIKIFLITVLILLSWNSFKSSENNEYLRTELKELTSNNGLLTESILNNKDLLQKQIISLEKNIELSTLNTEIIAKITNVEKVTSKISGLKESIDGVKKSVNKQSKMIDVNKKVIVSIKKPIYETLDTIKKHSKIYTKNSINFTSKIDENQKAITSIKKPLYETLDTVKKQSKINIKNSGTLTYKINENKKAIASIKKPLYETLDIVKKQLKTLTTKSNLKESYKINRSINTEEPVYFRDRIRMSYPVTLKSIIESENNSLFSDKNDQKKVEIKPEDKTNIISMNKLFFEFYKTKDLYFKNEIKAAMTQLENLKQLLWMSRDNQNISKELLISTLSSIDMIKTKWNNKEVSFDLENLEQQLNSLICKPGVCK